MKITVKDVSSNGCKHEVGEVYLWNDNHYMVIEGLPGDNKYALVCLETGSAEGSSYKSLSKLDKDAPVDKHVTAELIVGGSND